jgi:surface protein
MRGMFNYCQNLKNVNLLSFDTRNVKDMRSMFNLSFNLKNLDLSSFDIENVTKMEAFIAGGSINILNPFYLGGKIQIDNTAISNKIKVNKKSFEKFSKFINKESLYIE